MGTRIASTVAMIVAFLSSLACGRDQGKLDGSYEEFRTKALSSSVKEILEWSIESEIASAIDTKLQSRIGYDQADDGADLQTLTPAEQNFYLVGAFEMEVNNGGFHQYYFNSAGNYAHETVIALQKIGARKTAVLLVSANGIFPKAQVPKNRKARWEVLPDMERISGKANIAVLHNLDKKFYDYREDLTHLLVSYAKGNVGSFQ